MSGQLASPATWQPHPERSTPRHGPAGCLAERSEGRGGRRVSGPPYISTWDWPAAKESVAALVRLKPEVLACGHGRPMTGPQAAASLASFSGRFSRQPASRPFPQRPGGQGGKRPGAWRPSPQACLGVLEGHRGGTGDAAPGR